MNSHRTDLFDDVQRFVGSFGVTVLLKEMDIEKPGEFDGLTITINSKQDRESAGYYLAHSFGSIVLWSTDFMAAKKVFDDLRDAKKHRQDDPAGFEDAVARFREFEQTSSEYAVWMLAETGHAASIESYTVFFRADIEAMTLFHRTGKAPCWPDFYAEWKNNAASGEIRIEPFRPMPIPRFRPVRIAQQEVLQERE